MADKKAENQAFNNQLWACVATGLGGASMMFSMNFPTFGIPSMEKDLHFEMAPNEATWILSVVPAMAILGNFAGGLLVDTVGRRKTMLTGGLLHVIAYPLLALAPSVGHVLVSRALCGLGGSLLMIGGMVYMTEVQHPNYRDRFGSITGVLVNGGMLGAFVVGSFLEWRAMAWAGAALIVGPMMAMLATLRESPLYFIKQGNKGEALATLKLYRSSVAEANKELKELIESTRKNAEDKMNIGEMFRPPYSTPLVVALVLMVAQQATGITGITTYAVNIFEYLGTSIDPSYCTVMLGVVNILTALLGAEIHSRFNRKPTLIVTTGICVGTEVFFGLFFWARESGGALRAWTDENSNLALASILLFFISFGLGLGALPFMYLGEAMPSKIRGPASAIAITFSMVTLVVILQLFNPMVAALGYHFSFISFSVMTSLCVLWAHTMMVETKGKSISEMDDYYSALSKKKV